MITDAFKTSMETSLSTVGSDIVDIMQMVLPIGLGVFGFRIAVRIGIRFFSGLVS